MRKNKVLLIHGIDDTSRVFNKMTTFLEEKGFEVHAIDLNPGTGETPLNLLAKQVKEFADAKFESNEKFSIVAFSMGGIVARYYIQKLGGKKRLHKFISISSPHKGTVMAYLSKKEGVKQMRPGSKFLKDLNNEGINSMDFTSIWSPFDLMILPAHSSKLKGIQEHMVPVIAHPLMLSSKKVLELVVNTLSRD